MRLQEGVCSATRPGLTRGQSPRWPRSKLGIVHYGVVDNRRQRGGCASVSVSDPASIAQFISYAYTMSASTTPGGNPPIPPTPSGFPPITRSSPMCRRTTTSGRQHSRVLRLCRLLRGSEPDRYRDSGYDGYHGMADRRGSRDDSVLDLWLRERRRWVLQRISTMSYIDPSQKAFDLEHF
jgi:hypothetical protein